MSFWPSGEVASTPADGRPNAPVLPPTGQAALSYWINGLSNPIGESYHPNRTGHSGGYAPLVRQVMG